MSKVFFYGEAGRIEANIYTKKHYCRNPIALILHSNPDSGGSMDDKPVSAIANAFIKHHYTVMCINFRGVGKSQGKFKAGERALVDAATALDWLENHKPAANRICVSGFGFGGSIATQLAMRRPEVDHFVIASPLVKKDDFSIFSPCPIPGLICQGDQDDITQENIVTEFFRHIVEQKSSKVDYQTFKGANHFFSNQIDKLSNEIFEYIESLLEYLKKIPNSQMKKIKSNKSKLNEHMYVNL